MWNDLTMSERADVIKMAVKAGLRDMKSIRDFYDNSLKYADGGPKVTYGKPYYSYDKNMQIETDNGKPILNYSATLPEVNIIPDSKKSPADRNADERFRQKTFSDYAEHKDREYTQRQIMKSQRDWDNSLEKKALGYAQDAMTGIGIGADIVSGLPIYSSLKGSRILSEANSLPEYVEGGLWLAPIGGIVGKEAIGRQLYTDGLLSSIGNVGKNALKKAHIGNYYIKPQYNDYSYIRQVGDDAIEDMFRTNQMRSTLAIEHEQRPWNELGVLLGHEPEELSRMIPDGKGSMKIPFNFELRGHKLFEDQMYNTGRPFYGDIRTNYLVTKPHTLTDKKNLTNKGLEWIESTHKGHTGAAKKLAKDKGIDPNTAPGRIVVPLWNGDKNIIPVDALGEFDLYRPVKLGNISMPFYRRYSMPVNKKAEGGPKVTLVDNDKVRMSPSGTFSDENGNIIGDSVVIPNITIRAHKGYKSTYDMNLVNVPTTKQEIRKRLYENINPYDYGNAAIRVAKAVIGNTKEETISDGYYMPEVDDLWATYLQIPKSERHTENELLDEGHHLKVLPGIYKPTKGIGSGKYYRLNLNEDSKKAIVDEAMGNTYEVGFDVSPNPYNNHLVLKRIEKDPINIGQNRVATSYDRTLNWALRDFTVGRGRDNKGDYVSYYDLWDLSPYRISSKDQSFGIGNPFEIYGRIHLDDYYGVPKKYRGGNYLPEIIITGKEKEKAFGGNLLGGGHKVTLVDNR